MLELRDLGVELAADRAADRLPIACIGGTAARQARQRLGDLDQRQPQPLRDQDEAEAPDIAAPEALLGKLPGWRERWRGPAMAGGRTIHVGDEATYLALYTNGEVEGDFAKGAPLNHVGLRVDDLGAAKAIVTAAGLEPFSEGKYEPGPRSFYFLDWDGIEFEVVSYE